MILQTVDAAVGVMLGFLQVVDFVETKMVTLGVVGFAETRQKAWLLVGPAAVSEQTPGHGLGR